MAPGVADRFERGKDLEQARLLRGAAFEVTIDRRAKRAGIGSQQQIKRGERGVARGAIEAGGGIASASLPFEGVRQGS